MKNKAYKFKTFIFSKSVKVNCETYETRYSWGHKAELSIDGKVESYKKITYYNRTWESYTYQTILCSIVDSVSNKVINKDDKKKYQAMIKDQSFSQDEDFLGSVAMIAKLGDIFADGNQKQANDWKVRMLKAGLENKGLIMPDDWSELTEDDKEIRLNKAIEAIG